MKSRSPQRGRGGALLGLALLFAPPLSADDSLRQQVHRDYGHRSYMLVEDAEGARLYLFTDASGHAQLARIDASDDADEIARAVADTRSDNERERVGALTQLAGVDSPEALDAALTLLSDPSPAVRDEAANLILDHPAGRAMASALGLVDEDTEE